MGTWWWLLGAAWASGSVEPACAEQVDLGPAVVRAVGRSWVDGSACETESVDPRRLFGKLRWRDFDGRLSLTVRRSKGGEVELTAWAEDGVPAWRWTGRRRDGRAVADGLWQAWHPNGRLAEKGSYRDGLPDGRWFAFHRDGALAEEGVYYEGRPHGPWTCLFPDGRPSAGGDFDRGVRTGWWRWYDDSGRIWRERRQHDPTPIEGRATFGRGGFPDGVPALCAPLPQEHNSSVDPSGAVLRR